MKESSLWTFATDWLNLKSGTFSFWTCAGSLSIMGTLPVSLMSVRTQMIFVQNKTERCLRMRTHNQQSVSLRWWCHHCHTIVSKLERQIWLLGKRFQASVWDPWQSTECIGSTKLQVNGDCQAMIKKLLKEFGKVVNRLKEVWISLGKRCEYNLI